MSRFVAGTLAGISGVTILGALVVAGVLFNDINSLYFDVMDDMHEFKVRRVTVAFWITVISAFRR